MYAYKAALWCDSDGERIKEELDAEGVEDNGDTDTYPQYAFSDEETDSPSHCDAGEQCLEAETLSDGRKVGALLREALTSYGVAYVRDAIAEAQERWKAGDKTASVALELWRDAFSDYDIEEPEDEEEEWAEGEDDEPSADEPGSEDALEEAGEDVGAVPRAVMSYFILSDPANVVAAGTVNGLPCWMNDLTGVRVVVKPGGKIEEVW